jgi:sialate O-acetylesterase
LISNHSFNRCFAALMAAVVLSGTTLAAATPATPARIFSDHMVLQCDLAVPVWGKADAGANVVVEFDGQSVKAVADASGRWKATLQPMKANATGRALVVRCGDQQVAINDVLVGEVWFSGGQSNMEFSVGQMVQKVPEGKTLVNGAALNAVRFRRIKEGHSKSVNQDLRDASTWTVCSPADVLKHSAVNFVFALRLHRELGVPVGMIDCSWGGTPIEPYIPAEAFVGHPTLEKLATLAKAGDVAGIKALPGGTFVRTPAWLAAAIYNSRIAPVAPYAIRGALWYQGESNCGTGEDPRDYAQKMGALVNGWRAAFGRNDLPFFFVQLPQWKDYAWTYLREEQLRALKIPNTGMAVTIDLDNANDIHPPNKIDVGERLARWPLAKVYARDVPFSGPLYREMSVRGESVVVSFEHAEKGLMVGRISGVGKIDKAADGTLNGFELAGSDGEFKSV